MWKRMKNEHVFRSICRSKHLLQVHFDGAILNLQLKQVCKVSWSKLEIISRSLALHLFIITFITLKSDGRDHIQVCKAFWSKLEITFRVKFIHYNFYYTVKSDGPDHLLFCSLWNEILIFSRLGILCIKFEKWASDKSSDFRILGTVFQTFRYGLSFHE